MKRGRKAKAIEVKTAEGNAGKRKLNRRPPKVADGFPLPSFGLGPLAEKKWDERVEQLFPSGALKPTDSLGLTLLAMQEGYAARWFDGFEGLDPTQSGESSDQVSAELRARMIVLKELRLWLQLFGCTPGSRGQIIADIKDDDERTEEAAARPWIPRAIPGGKA